MGGGSIFGDFLKSLVFCFVVSMHNPETISDLSYFLTYIFWIFFYNVE